MSDSLLNLLEVLNEVLEEQELQEQASGGAPTLEEIYEPFVEYFDFYKKRLENIYDQLEQEKNSLKQKIKDRDLEQYKYARKHPDYKKSELLVSKLRRLENIYGLSDIDSKTTVFEKFNFTIRSIIKNIQDQRKSKSNLFINETPDKEKDIIKKFFAQSKDYILAKNLSLLQTQQGKPSTITHTPASKEEQNFYDIVLFTITQKIEGTSEFRNQHFFKEIQAKITKTNSDIINKKYYTYLFKNLKNGIGTYVISQEGTVFKKVDYFSEQKNTLDYLDLKSMIDKIDAYSQEYSDTKMKTMEFSKNYYYVNVFSPYVRYLKFENNKMSEAYRPLFTNLVKATFNEIFEEALREPEKKQKWSNILPYLIVSSTSGSLSNIEEYEQFANQWVIKFISKYDDFFSDFSINTIDPRYASMISDIKPNLGKTFTNPKINLSGGSLSNDFLFVVDNFFDSSANNFDSRKDQFSEKMSIFLKDSDELKNELSNIGLLDFMNRVLLMDYFVEFSKGFTNTTAGVLFEYFLAGLFNGEVVGHLQGVTDFKVGKELYSAKFLAPGTPVKQALSRFQEEEVEDETITYILGKKLKSYKAKKTGAFGVEEIHDVMLYKFQIKYTDGVFYVNGGKENAEDLGLVSIDAEQNVVMDRIVAQERPFTKIRMMSTDKDTIKAYREALKDKLSKSTEQVKNNKLKVLEFVQKLFDDLKDGDSSARRYVSSGDKNDGVKAITKLESATNGINDIMGVDEYSKFKDEPNDA